MMRINGHNTETKYPSSVICCELVFKSPITILNHVSKKVVTKVDVGGKPCLCSIGCSLFIPEFVSYKLCYSCRIWNCRPSEETISQELKTTYYNSKGKLCACVCECNMNILERYNLLF